MRFVIFRKADAETEAELGPGGMQGPEVEALMAQMLAYNEEMAKAGVLLGGDGLMPSSRGLKVKFSGGKPTVIDGPFAEAKELVAGYTLIEVASREEAIAWLKKWPPLDAHGHVELELRQIYEAEDFGEAFTPELREQNERIRALEGKNG
ncbi:MAG: YciI family protein [Hyphomicrobiales bacterium]|nr:MAG: YciI family protein [Hyphomicrobiales bacterium]